MLLNDMRAEINSTLESDYNGGSVTITNGTMPEKGERNVAIFEYAGMGPSVFTMGSEDNGNSLEACEHVAFQVQCRVGTDYDEAREILEIVYRRLNGRKDYQNPNDTEYLYQWIRAKHPPFHLGNDENNRPIVVCNFEAMRTRT